MPETKKPEVKREEYRKYLDSAGILDELTKFLVTLYEEPDKPQDAVAYMKKLLCGGEPDAAEVENMKSEIEQLKAQVEELTKRAEAAEAKILAATPAEAEPSAPEGEEAKPDAEEKKE
ncbi:Oidioi.mRNA.OKI2018_I69.XSR.g14840.t1.cds [Oikopleura dioica]|uniref:Oidioi.mRNA.OKI2018_I69.XSR.g14840.t1.cds n=1 Tax=Oikopleura dioica TaxID=34765 RepID=A0ABN7SJZ9_OIKDI|nr:Oidioi.mRNA.OKI2018_I69.XSR.g14840.t1.cds [Oikopleura dioica]